MSRRFSAESSFQPYFVGGVLAAHATSSGKGFRLRDAVFFINLCSNWMESFLQSHVLGATNVQVQRVLQTLVEDGFAKRTSKARFPLFTLTRAGVLESLRRLGSQDSFPQFEQFLFAFYFMRSYRDRIEKLVMGSQEGPSPTFRTEIETLCDPELLLLKQRRFLKEQLRKLEARIQSTEGAIALSTKQPTVDDALLENIQDKFPYQLNSERPMRSLLKGLMPSDAHWELTEGNRLRLNLLWDPTFALLTNQLQILDGLNKWDTPSAL